MLEPCLERGDLLVRLHILDGERDLARGVPEEFGVGLRVLVGLHARDRERSDRGGPDDERHDHVGPNAVLEGAVLHRALTLLRKVVPEEGPLGLEHTADVALAGRHLEADREVRRRQRRFEDEQPQDVALGIVQEDGGPVKGHDAAERLGDRVEERVPREGIAQHPPNLLLQARRVLKLSTHGRLQQLVVGNAAPQEK